jgi:hypothetical protein
MNVIRILVIMYKMTLHIRQPLCTGLMFQESTNTPMMNWERIHVLYMGEYINSLGARGGAVG